MSRILLALALLAAALPAAAATYSLVSSTAAMVNHWPGADGYVGTADDVIDGNPSPLHASDPNASGGYCYNAFDFGGGVTDVGLPTGYNAITFVDGTVDIDLDVAASGGGALVTGLDISSGSQPYAGHGPFIASFTNIRSGSYSTITGVFSFTADLQATLGGGSDQADGMVLNGTAWVLDEADYAAGAGDVYVDNVLVPLAQSVGATSLVYLRASGTIPAANGASWPSMPFTAVIVGLADSTPTAGSSLSAIKALY